MSQDPASSQQPFQPPDQSSYLLPDVPYPQGLPPQARQAGYPQPPIQPPEFPPQDSYPPQPIPPQGFTQQAQQTGYPPQPFPPQQAQQTGYPPQPFPPQGVPPYQSRAYQPPMMPMQQQQAAQGMAPQAFQQPYYPQQQVPMMNGTTVNVNIQQRGPGFLVRALYFCFIGWWAGLFWLNVGFFFCAMIFTLPVGLIMLNRIPQVMTLKPAGTKTNVNVSTMTMQTPGGQFMQQNINVNIGATQQYNFFVRALYYIFVGCWAGYIWANIAYACCLLIVLLPVGIMMFDRLPMVLTLRKN